MAQDNGLSGGVSISGLALKIPRSTRLGTVRQRTIVANRVNRQVARQTGQSLASIQSKNVGMRVVNERRRM